MRKVIRTSERCYICDFSSPLSSEGGEYEVGSSVDSVYQDSLIELFQASGGRFVFIHPTDGMPVCSQCSDAVKRILNEWRWLEKPLDWQTTNHEIFQKWEKTLAQESSGEPLAPDAGTKVETELETT